MHKPVPLNLFTETIRFAGGLSYAAEVSDLQEHLFRSDKNVLSIKTIDSVNLEVTWEQTRENRDPEGELVSLMFSPVNVESHPDLINDRLVVFND